jgi:hypothetical protein
MPINARSMNKLERALRRVGLVQDLSDQPVLQPLAENIGRLEVLKERFGLLAAVAPRTTCPEMRQTDRNPENRVRWRTRQESLRDLQIRAVWLRLRWPWASRVLLRL